MRTATLPTPRRLILEPFAYSTALLSAPWSHKDLFLAVRLHSVMAATLHRCTGGMGLDWQTALANVACLAVAVGGWWHRSRLAGISRTRG